MHQNIELVHHDAPPRRQGSPDVHNCGIKRSLNTHRTYIWPRPSLLSLGGANLLPLSRAGKPVQRRKAAVKSGASVWPTESHTEAFVGFWPFGYTLRQGAFHVRHGDEERPRDTFSLPSRRRARRLNGFEVGNSNPTVFHRPLRPLSQRRVIGVSAGG